MVFQILTQNLSERGFVQTLNKWLMRIIGGRAKGRRIFTPKGCRIRPTSDIVKESLFNMLPSIKGKLFFDLFAGTGNVGLEALSRGASRAVFVERNPHLVEAINKNLSICGFNENYEIISATVKNGVKLLNKRREQFNIIFVDPPYEKDIVKKIFHIHGIRDLISQDGVMVIQHSLREKLDTDNVILTDQRRYGDTILSFIKMKHLRQAGN
jgi:16S rRNA (guanine(966)-N(2))-methyltransferase RsmD